MNKEKIFRCECNNYKLWYQEYCYACLKDKIKIIEGDDKNE